MVKLTARLEPVTTATVDRSQIQVNEPGSQRVGESSVVLVKGVAADQVLSAVRAVASGHAVFGPTLAARMPGLFAPSAAADPTRPKLSVREDEVLELIAEGLTNTEIAARLFISPVTARNHVSNILTKLRVSNRTQAAQQVRRHR